MRQHKNWHQGVHTGPIPKYPHANLTRRRSTSLSLVSFFSISKYMKALPRRIVPGCFFTLIDDPPINQPAACPSTPLGASSPLDAQQIVPPRCFLIF